MRPSVGDSRLAMRKIWYLLRETGHYLRQTKRWWLLPIVITILILALLALLLHTASTYPIIYPFL